MVCRMTKIEISKHDEIIELEPLLLILFFTVKFKAKYEIGYSLSLEVQEKEREIFKEKYQLNLNKNN